MIYWQLNEHMWEWAPTVRNPSSCRLTQRKVFATRAGRDVGRKRIATIAAGIVLLASAILGYRWLAARPLEIDEFLSFFSDNQPTAKDVISVQLHYPISLDPPVYHLLSHWAMQLFGATAIALRLPALLGYLLFQATLFLFVRRIAGWRAALLAMLFPLITQNFFYATQGRPYGLLMGAYGLAMVCWQGATRAQESRRAGWLCGLAFALVLGVWSHFFGLLILLPIFAGELARTVRRSRVDRGIAICLAIGAASMALLVPFQRASAEYRVHYYDTRVPANVIPQSYAALFVAHHLLPMWEQRVYLAVLCISMAAVAVAFGLYWRRRPELSHEFFAIAALGLLPVFGYLLGVTVTHTVDVRYVVATMFALMAGLGIVLEPALRRTVFFSAIVVLIGVLAVFYRQRNTFDSRLFGDSIAKRFELSPEVKQALEENPSRPIYIQSLADFYENWYYVPDPMLRARFSMVYSQKVELSWLGHDTNYLTARNMTHFTPFSFTPYAEMLAAGGHPLVLNYHDGWDWLGRDLASRHVPMRKIGEMMGGELDELDLAQGTRAQSVSSGLPRSVDRTGKPGVN